MIRDPGPESRTPIRRIAIVHLLLVLAAGSAHSSEYRARPPDPVASATVSDGKAQHDSLVVLIAGVAWLVGGNIITAVHCVRRGKPCRSVLRPWAYPIRDFTWGEYGALVALGAVCLAIFAIGLST